VTPPYTLPLDIEVWADREKEIEALFEELHETDPEQGDVQQPEGAR